MGSERIEKIEAYRRPTILIRPSIVSGALRSHDTLVLKPFKIPPVNGSMLQLWKSDIGFKLATISVEKYAIFDFYQNFQSSSLGIGKIATIKIESIKVNH